MILWHDTLARHGLFGMLLQDMHPKPTIACAINPYGNYVLARNMERSLSTGDENARRCI